MKKVLIIAVAMGLLISVPAMAKKCKYGCTYKNVKVATGYKTKRVKVCKRAPKF